MEALIRRNVGESEYLGEASPFQAWYDIACCKPRFEISTPTTGSEDNEAFGVWLFGFDVMAYESLEPQWVFEGWGYSFPHDFDMRQPNAILFVPYEEE